MSGVATAGDGARRRSRKGVVTLLGALLPLAVAAGVSGPRLWHGVRSEPSPSVAVSQLPAQQPAAASQLPAEQAPKPAPGQVGDLGRFAARDPFASPLPARRAKAAAAAASAAPAPASAAPAPAPASAAPALAAPAAPASAAATPAVQAATISVNGIPEQVAVGGSFPAASPQFRVAALGAGSVQVAVLAAPAADGSAAAAPPQTVTLEQGRTLTLLDTATGARYELALVVAP
mgnify:CR=1 FL=1